MTALLLALALSQADAGPLADAPISTPAIPTEHQYPDCERNAGSGWDAPAAITDGGYLLTFERGAYNVCRQEACEQQLDMRVPTATRERTYVIAPWAAIAVTAVVGIALAVGAVFVGREIGRVEKP